MGDGEGKGGLLGRQPKPLELLLPLYAHEGIAECCTAEEKPVRSDCIRALALVQPHLKRAAAVADGNVARMLRPRSCMLHGMLYVVCCMLYVVYRTLYAVCCNGAAVNPSAVNLLTALRKDAEGNIHRHAQAREHARTHNTHTRVNPHARTHVTHTCRLHFGHDV